MNPSPVKRFLARIVDNIPLFIIIILTVFYFAVMISLGNTYSSRKTMGTVSTIYSLASLLLYGLWFLIAIINIFILSTSGQTIGKKLFNLRVVMIDGSNGGFVSNFLMRELVNGLISMIPFYSMVDVLFVFSSEGRCIHDKLSNTKVVDSRYSY